MAAMPATTPPPNTGLQPAAVTRRALGWRPAGIDCETVWSGLLRVELLPHGDWSAICEVETQMTTEPCGHAASH
jgi:hypothetical protein